MDRYEAARALGVADADLLAVAETADGVQVEMTGGGRRLIRDDGVYALDDHTSGEHLRRWTEPVNPLDEVAAEAEENAQVHLTPRDGSGVPSGTANAVLDWVGDDPERAAAALTVETERENPRSVLVSKLRKVAER